MLSFYELEKSLFNESVAKNYFETLLTQNDNSFKYSRRQGILEPNDPINQYKTNDSINVVWITGMWSGIVPGTGKYKELLSPLGYNIQVVKTLANMKAAGLGRIVRHLPILNTLHKKIADPHVQKNQDKVLGEMGDNTPDIIIGSSQGGAIALSVANKYQDVPMVLLCPAWKIFGVHPTYINPQSVIIHGIADIEVPIQDSIELSKMFNVKLIKTPDGHIMSYGLSILVNQLHNLAVKKRKTENTDINFWIA